MTDALAGFFNVHEDARGPSGSAPTLAVCSTCQFTRGTGGRLEVVPVPRRGGLLRRSGTRGGPIQY